jgi:hypothetical protein
VKLREVRAVRLAPPDCRTRESRSAITADQYSVGLLAESFRADGRKKFAISHKKYGQPRRRAVSAIHLLERTGTGTQRGFEDAASGVRTMKDVFEIPADHFPGAEGGKTISYRRELAAVGCGAGSRSRPHD